MNKKVKFLSLIPIIYFSVSGGPYGLEEIVSSVGPLLTLVLILVLPVVWTIPEAMIVAELSSNFPVQGGYYKWVQFGLGNFWGFMEGWWSILYTIIDLSLYPILFGTYLKFLFPHINFNSLYFIQLLMIWTCVVINFIGIKSVSNVLAFIKMFILISFLFFILLTLSHVSFDIRPLFVAQKQIYVNDFLFGLSLAFWNFIGWDNPSSVLGEIEKAEKIYHKALFCTIPIVVLFYFLPVLSGSLVHTNWSDWKFGEFSYIAKSISHPLLATLLAVGGMLSCLGLFNSLLLSSTRVFSVMSEDGYFPKILSLIHPRFKTPYVCIFVLGIVYSFLILLDFRNLVIYDVFLYLIAMSLEAIALYCLRKKEKCSNHAFKIPFGSYGLWTVLILVIINVSFIVLVNFLELIHSFQSMLFALFLIFSGVPIYFFCKFLKPKC